MQGLWTLFLILLLQLQHPPGTIKHARELIFTESEDWCSLEKGRFLALGPVPTAEEVVFEQAKFFFMDSARPCSANKLKVQDCQAFLAVVPDTECLSDMQPMLGERFEESLISRAKSWVELQVLEMSIRRRMFEHLSLRPWDILADKFLPKSKALRSVLEGCMLVPRLLAPVLELVFQEQPWFVFLEEVHTRCGDEIAELKGMYETMEQSLQHVADHIDEAAPAALALAAKATLDGASSTSVGFLSSSLAFKDFEQMHFPKQWQAGKVLEQAKDESVCEIYFKARERHDRFWQEFERSETERKKREKEFEQRMYEAIKKAFEQPTEEEIKKEFKQPTEEEIKGETEEKPRR